MIASSRSWAATPLGAAANPLIDAKTRCTAIGQASQLIVDALPNVTRRRVHIPSGNCSSSLPARAAPARGWGQQAAGPQQRQARAAARKRGGNMDWVWVRRESQQRGPYKQGQLAAAGECVDRWAVCFKHLSVFEQPARHDGKASESRVLRTPPFL